MMTNFDVNKIQELEVTDKYFRRDETFNLQKHSEDCFGIFHEVPFDVEWQFDKEVANCDGLFRPTRPLLSVAFRVTKIEPIQKAYNFFRSIIMRGYLSLKL